ncbi:MAG: precorrin-6A reductase [Clostridia bacterium]|nr:precorrin-6A reductase [Clostridia bacterium]
MILVLAGTTEAREVIRALADRGLEVAATAVTEYGAVLARAAGASRVRVGPLGEADLHRLVEELNPRAVVDATHPFAVKIRELARSVCRAYGLPLFRYLRPTCPLPEHPLVTVAGNAAEAAEAAAAGSTVFLAVGTRLLGEILGHPALKGKRLVVRILPDPRSLEHCLALGISPRDIVAAQGPFSVELNRAMLRHFGAQVLVTKESGRPGGLEEKLAAALSEGIRAVVIRRPREEEGEDVAAILKACVRLSGGESP